MKEKEEEMKTKEKARRKAEKEKEARKAIKAMIRQRSVEMDEFTKDKAPTSQDSEGGSGEESTDLSQRTISQPELEKLSAKLKLKLGKKQVRQLFKQMDER